MGLIPSLRNLPAVIAPTIFGYGKTTGFKRRAHVLEAHSLHWRNGKLIFAEGAFQRNILHDEGELFILNRTFDTDASGYASVNDMYLGIDNRTSLAEGDTLASLSSEPSGSGYARQAIRCNASGSGSTDFAISNVTDYQASTGTITLTASGGNWGTQRNRFLCTHASATTSGSGQRLIATVAFSTARTINDGDSIQTSLIIRLSE